MWNNCFIWSLTEYLRALAAWGQSGYPKGQEPSWGLRCSRLAARWVPHWYVGRYDPELDVIRVRSFKPLDKTPLRWWQLWRVFWFPGEVVEGDRDDF